MGLVQTLPTWTIVVAVLAWMPTPVGAADDRPKPARHEVLEVGASRLYFVRSEPYGFSRDLITDGAGEVTDLDPAHYVMEGIFALYRDRVAGEDVELRIPFGSETATLVRPDGRELEQKLDRAFLESLYHVTGFGSQWEQYRKRLELEEAAREDLAVAIEALSNEDPAIRAAVARILGEGGDRGAVDALVVALEDPEQDVRFAAAGALGALGDERAREPLEAASQDVSTAVAVRAQESLEQVKRAAALQELVDGLGDADPEIRKLSARRLANTGDPMAATALTQALSDPLAEVRAVVAECLAMVGGDAAVDALVGALRDETCDVRFSSALALAELADPRALEPLRQAVRAETEFKCRVALVNALDHVQRASEATEPAP